jgi:hypothetical protein
VGDLCPTLYIHIILKHKAIEFLLQFEWLAKPHKHWQSHSKRNWSSAQGFYWPLAPKYGPQCQSIIGTKWKLIVTRTYAIDYSSPKWSVASTKTCQSSPYYIFVSNPTWVYGNFVKFGTLQTNSTLPNRPICLLYVQWACIQMGLVIHTDQKIELCTCTYLVRVYEWAPE